MALYSLVLMCR